jgi:hypothetical protein
MSKKSVVKANDEVEVPKLDAGEPQVVKDSHGKQGELEDSHAPRKK